MGVDATRSPVIERSKPQRAFQLPSANREALQLLAAKGEISGGEHVIVAVHDELSIEGGEGVDVSLLDARVAVHRQAGVATVSARGTRLTHTLCAR